MDETLLAALEIPNELIRLNVILPSGHSEAVYMPAASKMLSTAEQDFIFLSWLLWLCTRSRSRSLRWTICRWACPCEGFGPHWGVEFLPNVDGSEFRNRSSCPKTMQPKHFFQLVLIYFEHFWTFFSPASERKSSVLRPRILELKLAAQKVHGRGFLCLVDAKGRLWLGALGGVLLDGFGGFGFLDSWWMLLDSFESGWYFDSCPVLKVIASLQVCLWSVVWLFWACACKDQLGHDVFEQRYLGATRWFSRFTFGAFGKRPWFQSSLCHGFSAPPTTVPLFGCNQKTCCRHCSKAEKCHFISQPMSFATLCTFQPSKALKHWKARFLFLLASPFLD